MVVFTGMTTTEPYATFFVCLFHEGACVSTLIRRQSAQNVVKITRRCWDVSSNICMSRTMATHGAPAKVIQPTIEGDGRILNTPFMDLKQSRLVFV